MEKVLHLKFESSLTILCENNSSFDSGVLKIAYSGENRNGSYISKESFLRAMKSIYNCPVVCRYDRETDSLGGHDMELVSKDDKLYMVNLTTPVGCIPESAKTWFESVVEEDGSVHEYLFAEALIWKRQEAYQKIKSDGITSQSMEIKVKDGEVIDGIYHIKDFEFTAFALIGVEPCFESASIEMQTQEDFKFQLSEMMKDLRNCYSMVATPNGDNDIDLQHQTTKGGNKALEEKISLAEQYGIDIESLDFSIEDLSVDELKEKFESLSGDAKDDNGDSDFALTSNIIEEIIKAISEEKMSCEWGEYSRYSYVDCDIENKEVFCWDETDWLLYGFAFTFDGDNIVIDYESKKRKKYVIDDFDEGEQANQVSPFADTFNAISDYANEYSELKSKYESMGEEMTAMKAELEDLRDFRANVELAEAKQKREDLFSQFNDIAETEEFQELKENSMEYDIDEIEEKCYAIRGKQSSVVAFSATNKSPKLMVSQPTESNEPYGGVFVKYGFKSKE